VKRWRKKRLVVTKGTFSLKKRYINSEEFADIGKIKSGPLVGFNKPGCAVRRSLCKLPLSGVNTILILKNSKLTCSWEKVLWAIGVFKNVNLVFFLGKSEIPGLLLFKGLFCR
jgi:hypothetical protein